MSREAQAHSAIVELAKACDLKHGQTFIDRDDLQVLLTIVLQQFEAQIHRDALEDNLVSKTRSALIYAEDCLSVAFDVSDEYSATERAAFVQNFFNGDHRAAARG